MIKKNLEKFIPIRYVVLRPDDKYDFWSFLEVIFSELRYCGTAKLERQEILRK